MSSTAHSNRKQNYGCIDTQDIMNEKLEMTMATDSIFPTMNQHFVYPMTVYGHCSYKTNSFATLSDDNTAINTRSCSPHQTMTSSSSCELTCIKSGKSIHDLKSLAITAISTGNANWSQIIIKDNGLQNKPVTTVKIGCFIKECKRSLDNGILPFIPVVFNDKIGYIKLIQIGSEYAGIGFRIDHVNEKLLCGFYGECAEYKLLPSDIFGLIMRFCTTMEVSTIHLDPDYILDHHQLLPTNKQCNSILDFLLFAPFISYLFIKFEIDGLCVQSDWEDDK